MRIKVNNVSQEQKDKKFSFVEVAYESDGKAQNKKIFSFNTGVYEDVKKAQTGDVFDVKLEKDRNGYWVWKEMHKADPTATGGNMSTPASTRTSTYETPEERARRQILIVRQSSIAQAVAYFNGAVVPPELERVLDVAAQFETWVNRE